MSTSYFRNLFFFLFVAIAALGSAHAQTVSVNGVNCSTATVTMGQGTLAISTAGCSGTVATAPTINSGTPPATGTVNTAYSFQFSATGSPTITWSILSGTPPSGVTINSSTGVLSGTPTAQGTNVFTVQAANGTAPNANC